MSVIDFARALVGTLPPGGIGTFNPWRDICAEDASWNGPEEKLGRLAAHLDCDPQFILCGEAPGYQGCRHSGIAFTSERLLLEGAIPRVARADRRLTSRELPYSEPSATIVWKTLYGLGIAERTILWNALQMHPYRVGDFRSNRTPTAAEISMGEPALRMLLDRFPGASVIAVGKKANDLLRDMGVRCGGSVRHPANGGASEFADGLARFVRCGQTQVTRA